MASRTRRKRRDSRPSYRDRCPGCHHGRIKAKSLQAGGGVVCSLACGWWHCA